jgi:hypothetical protein
MSKIEVIKDDVDVTFSEECKPLIEAVEGRSEKFDAIRIVLSHFGEKGYPVTLVKYGGSDRWIVDFFLTEMVRGMLVPDWYTDARIPFEVRTYVASASNEVA